MVPALAGLATCDKNKFANCDGKYDTVVGVIEISLDPELFLLYYSIVMGYSEKCHTKYCQIISLLVMHSHTHMLMIMPLPPKTHI